MKYAVLIIALVVTSGFTMAQRSSNARTANERATAMAAFTDPGQLATAQSSLENFVATHVNASVMVQRVAAYQEAVKAAQVAAGPQPTSLYEQAQAACAGRGNSIVQAQCNQAFLRDRAGPTPTPVPVVMPDANLYRSSLTSPLVARDAATGWLAASLLILLVLIGLAARSLTRRPSF